jgi:nucleotidyltransferase/DNA polymerase involved in DNA repair
LGALDGEACRALLGQSGPLYAERARGLDGRAVDGSQPPRSLAREVTLAEPTRDEGRLLSVLQHVCDTLSARLRQMGWFAHTVALRLSLDEPERLAAPFGATTRSLTLREATAQPDALMSAARALFRAHWRHRAVVRLGLTVTNLQSVGPQIPLFPVAERVSAAGLRTRPGFRALVEGRYLEPHRGRRRVG